MGEEDGRFQTCLCTEVGRVSLKYSFLEHVEQLTGTKCQSGGEVGKDEVDCTSLSFSSAFAIALTMLEMALKKCHMIDSGKTRRRV